MLEMSGDVVDELFDQHCSEKYVDQWDASGFNQAFNNIFGKLPKENWHEQELDAEEFREEFHQQVEDFYREKLMYFHNELGQNLAAEQAAAGVDEEDKDKSARFDAMVVDLERQILLKINDGLWKDHLLSMDHLREGISLVGYAQKKPLDEYKRQAFDMFSDLMARISREAVSLFYKIRLGQVQFVQFRKPCPSKR